MTIEMLQVLAIAAIILSLAAIAVAIIAMRNRRGLGTAGHQKLENEMNALRTDIESLRDRSRLIEERFERYDRTHVELRDAHDRMREDVDARLARVQSQESAQKALQEQIYEMRKEHQVLMERGDRHERRVTELQDQLNSLNTEFAAIRTDGKRARV